MVPLIERLSSFCLSGARISSKSGSETNLYNAHTKNFSWLEEDWVVIDKPIETSPLFDDLSDAEIQSLNKAIAENETPTIGFAEDSTMHKLYKRLLRGQTSYTLYAPLVRKTTPYDTKPPEGDAGSITDAPSGAPTSWKWRKTAYRRVRPGQNSAWDLVEEWTGADEWDDEVYSGNS